MGLGPRAKQQRPAYKMHKKAARSKGTRGVAVDGGGDYDGAALRMGKKGGLVRVAL